MLRAIWILMNMYIANPDEGGKHSKAWFEDEELTAGGTEYFIAGEFTFIKRAGVGKQRWDLLNNNYVLLLTNTKAMPR